MRSFYILLFIFSVTVVNIQAARPFYKSGFDSEKELKGWKYFKKSHWWGVDSKRGKDGSTCMSAKRADKGNFLISPELKLSKGLKYLVSFDVLVSPGHSKAGMQLYLIQGDKVTDKDKPIYDKPLHSHYVKTPYKNYIVTFSPPKTGKYRIAWKMVFNSYRRISIDDVFFEKVHAPKVAFLSPKNKSIFKETDSIQFKIRATDTDGNIAKVELFERDKKIAELTKKPFSFTTSFLPGIRKFYAKATDNRGIETKSRPLLLKVTFEDGTLAPYLHYSFDDAQGWKANGGWQIKFKKEFGSSWHSRSIGPENSLVSPPVNLVKGEEYTLSFLHDSAGKDPMSWYCNTKPEVGGLRICQFNAPKNDYFSTRKYCKFTCQETGRYYIVGRFEVKRKGYQKFNIDELRLVGKLNNSPRAKIINKAKSIVKGSVLYLETEALDTDGKVTRVEYYQGDKKIGESTEAPYKLEWKVEQAGDLQIYSKAWDDKNGWGNSETITVSSRENPVSFGTAFGTGSARGVIAQPDGNIVVGIEGNSGITEAQTFTIAGPKGKSEGELIRYASDGEIISVTKLPDRILDMSTDKTGNIYIAAGKAGAYKIDPLAQNIIWHKPEEAQAVRIDAGPRGTAAVMYTSTADIDRTKLLGNGVKIFSAQGDLLGSMGGFTFATLDICIDETSKTIIGTGYKNVHANTRKQTLPVDIPIILGRSYDGQEKFRCYDWVASKDSDRWLNKPENNMADARGVRCEIGEDCKLYVAFEFDGGNHLFRYSPFDVMQKVSNVGGDKYFEMYNTSTEPKTFIGRYDSATGEYLLGQAITCRLPNKKGNTIVAKSLTAGKDGTVYFGGSAAFGLPLTVDHFPGEYTGGAFVMALSPDFKTREIVTRISVKGATRGIAVLPDKSFVAVGESQSELNLPQKIVPGDPKKKIKMGWMAIFQIKK